MGLAPPRAAAFLTRELTIIVAANIAGRCISRFGERPVLLAGVTVFALGRRRLPQLAAHEASLARILPGTVLIGIGAGFAWSGPPSP
jgi:hypothetical protein